LFCKSWIEAAQFGLEAQSVITMRLLKIRQLARIIQPVDPFVAQTGVLA
jgi:hypothetical protein